MAKEQRLAFSFDIVDLVRLRAGMKRDLQSAMLQAYKRAVKRTLTGGIAHAARMYKEDYPAAKIGVIKERSFRWQANYSAQDIEAVGGAVLIRNKGMLIEEMGAKRVSKGVQYKGLKGAPVFIYHGFSARMPNNTSAHWWARRGKDRSPLRLLYAASPFDMFKQEEPRTKLGEYLRDRFAGDMSSAMSFYLSKAMK